MIEKDLVIYRRAKAVETLDDARVLVEHGRLDSAVNRIYYAVFYIVSALLLTRRLSSSKTQWCQEHVYTILCQDKSC